MAIGEPLLVTCSVCTDCVPEKDAEIVLETDVGEVKIFICLID